MPAISISSSVLLPSGPVGTALSALRTALQDSNVPILVQVHDWALLPEAFHNEIEREHIVIQSETTRPTTSR